MDLTEIFIDTKNELSKIPQAYGEGDEVLSKITPKLTEALQEITLEEKDISEKEMKRNQLQKDTEMLSAQLTQVSSEVLKSFKTERPQTDKESEKEKARQFLAQGGSLF